MGRSAPGTDRTHPLEPVDLAVPEPRDREVRVRVLVCGVCRTDLHLAEGDLPPRRSDAVPGHEVVGVIDATGPNASRFSVGDRVGIAWLRSTCGTCRFCPRGAENLCLEPRFTGWDADGGYAEHAVVDERYAYAIPDTFSDETGAPLLCAGIIGYRALRRAALPAGGRLGIYGFGASAHLAAQVAITEGATVHVVSRAPRSRLLALELGSAWAVDVTEPPPERLDSAIIFAPAGSLVPRALQALDRGGTLAIAGIYMTEIPALDHDLHLFQERQLRSVTANTRRDGEEFLAVAARIGLQARTTTYPLEAAAEALRDLAHGDVTGAAVPPSARPSRSEHDRRLWPAWPMTPR